MTTRPLLLVDVDGVLNPLGVPEPPPSYEPHDFTLGFAVQLAPEHGTWLSSLTDVYELMWATSWEHYANRLICPVLGLPELPVIEFPPTPEGTIEKLPPVAAAVGARACAWIDDMHTPAHHAWARAREAPTLVLDIEPTLGLRREHIDRLRTWGSSLVASA